MGGEAGCKMCGYVWATRSLIRYLASHIKNDHMCGRYLVAAGHLDMNGFFLGNGTLFCGWDRSFGKQKAIRKPS